MKRIFLWLSVLALIPCVGCDTLVPPETSSVSSSITTTTTPSTAVQITTLVQTTTSTQSTATVPTTTVVSTTSLPTTSVTVSATVSPTTATRAMLSMNHPELPSLLGVPDINDFSSTEYEAYQRHFPTVSSAVLHTDNTTQEIAADDPRLIRLLNAIACQYNDSSCIWLQGELSESKVAEYTQSVSFLEVYFKDWSTDDENADSIVEQTPKVVIWSGVCAMYTAPEKDVAYPEEFDGPTASVIYPYMSFLSAAMREGVVEKDYNFSAGEGWPDLLTYAGF